MGFLQASRFLNLDFRAVHCFSQHLNWFNPKLLLSLILSAFLIVFLIWISPYSCLKSVFNFKTCIYNTWNLLVLCLLILHSGDLVLRSIVMLPLLYGKRVLFQNLLCLILVLWKLFSNYFFSFQLRGWTYDLAFFRLFFLGFAPTLRLLISGLNFLFLLLHFIIKASLLLCIQNCPTSLIWNFELMLFTWFGVLDACQSHFFLFVSILKVYFRLLDYHLPWNFGIFLWLITISEIENVINWVYYSRVKIYLNLL